MLSLETLDIALGLVLLYLTLALVCTAANELIATLFNLRGATLRAGIANLLRLPEGTTAPPALPAPAPGAQPITAAPRMLTLNDIYNHPLIRGLYTGRHPSYIPSKRFALALIDTLVPAVPGATPTMPALTAAICSLQNTELKRALLAVLASAGDNFTTLQQNIAEWFDQAMERVSGWYKRQLQWITLGMAALVTAVANADTLAIAQALSTDGVLRQAIVAQAQAFAQRPSPTGNIARRDSVPQTTVPPDSLERALAGKIGASLSDLEHLGLPLGWQRATRLPDAPAIVTKVLGLLLTAFAVSLGAPFWFDALSNIMSVRGAGAVPQTAPASSSRVMKNGS